MKHWFLYTAIVLFLLVSASACKPASLHNNADGHVQNSTLPVDGSSHPTEFMPAENTNTPTTLEASIDDKLWIKIDEPQDGVVVNTPQVELKGHASIDTVITINDEILYLENSQDFTTTLNLSSEANLFEIIASDIHGNELTLYLTVYCEP